MNDELKKSEAEVRTFKPISNFLLTTGYCFSFLTLPAKSFAVAPVPRVAAHMVAAFLPEARLIFFQKAYALDPLG